MPMPGVEVDEILAKCGDFHRYQFLLLLLFSLINVLSSMHYYSQTIISFVPEHWCFDENLRNLTRNEITEMLEDSHEMVCHSKRTEDNATSCNQWDYNLDYGYESMTSDLNWVCDAAWKSALGQSMFFVGSVVGSLCLGIIADIVGRVPVLIIANMLAFIGNISTIFGTTVVSFSLCRFISGLATDSNFVMMYILVMEYLRPSQRTAGLSICIGIFYCLGSVVTPWLAVLAGNWKMFLIFSGAPMLVVPFFYFIVAESAQWLISTGRYDRAIKSFKRIAKFNRKHVDDSVFKDFRLQCENGLTTSSKKSNVLGLFKTPRLRKHTLILFFKSMIITLCYDATSRNVEGLGISPFVMFSLSATAILPACVVLLLLQDKIGRKAMASSSLLLSGIFTSGLGLAIAYGIPRGENPYILAGLATVGRFGVTVAYNSGAQYAAELIPTCVRAQGIAAVHVVGYAFTFFSSYILLLSKISKSIPALLLGLLSLIGAGLCLFLPETLKRTLPCTLEDGEHFGRGERIFDFSCCKINRNKNDMKDNS